MLRYIILAVHLMLVSASQANMYSFETDELSPFVLDYGARISSDSEHVLSGSQSLFVETSDTGETWNEFFSTDPDLLHLPAGTRWLIQFRVRTLALDPSIKDPQIYFLLRSKATSGGHPLDQFGPWLSTSVSEERVCAHVFQTNEVDDYYLIIGIMGKGALVLDDLRIEQIEWTSAPAGYGEPVVTTLPQGLDWVASMRPEVPENEQDLIDLLAQAIVIVCNEGAGSKASADKVCPDIQPDLVDWNPLWVPGKGSASVKDLCGIRTTIGGTEYQELYAFEMTPEVYAQRWELFNDGQGFTKGLWGQIFSSQAWGEGGYFMCNNGPRWHEVLTDSIMLRLDDFEGICQDNIAVAPWEHWGGFVLPGGGCFCGGCAHKFRQWLGERYSPEHLHAWGVENLNSFLIADRIHQYGHDKENYLQDPLTREYWMFQYHSQLGNWAAIYGKVKQWSVENEYPVPCYGNQIGVQTGNPLALSLSQWCDVVQVEELLGVGDEIPRLHTTYLLGRASGNHRKPVWVRGPITNLLADEASFPEYSILFWKTHLFEALACGGVRDLSLGQNAPGNPPDFIDDPGVYQTFIDYSEFCRSYRRFFTFDGRQHQAQVALLYSIPTVLWERYAPFGWHSHRIFHTFRDQSAALDEAHIPHQAFLLGHPYLFDPELEIETMLTAKQYPVIVLGDTESISDRHLAMLKRLQSEGSKIFRAGSIGEFDEFYNPRTLPEWVSGLPMFATEAITKIQHHRVLSGDIPEDCIVVPWDGAEWVSAQFVRYATPFRKVDWTPSDPFEFVVEAPRTGTNNQVWWVSPDEAAPLALAHEELTPDAADKRARVRVEIPSFQYFGALIIGVDPTPSDPS